MPNAYDQLENYGPSSFDTRHMLVVNYVWDIQYGNQLASPVLRTILKKWQISGTSQFQSGAPLSVSTSTDYAGVGPGSGNQYWLITGSINRNKVFNPTGSKSGPYFFNNTAFAAPATGTFAPRGVRNQIFGPGFQSWNFAMQKTFPFGDTRSQMKFKAEAFNFMNHPNLDNPNTNPTSGTFGMVTTKGGTYASDRQFQFSLRYEF
jgi:hypothetical protein